LTAQLLLESRVLGLKLFGARLPLGLGPFGDMLGVGLRFARLRGPVRFRLCVIHGAVPSGSNRIFSLWRSDTAEAPRRAARYLLAVNPGPTPSPPPPPPPAPGPPPRV